MRRREFITLLRGAAAAWPLAARAQQGERMRRVGVLTPYAADDREARARLAASLQALQQLGWADGRNVRIDTSVRELPAAGGLISHGNRVTDAYRRAGLYAGRILKGTTPADMPVDRATKFKLVINLGTAK